MKTNNEEPIDPFDTEEDIELMFDMGEYLLWTMGINATEVYKIKGMLIDQQFEDDAISK